MAIGKVIGRVAIKVLPDTSEFREKTANDLRRIEKQLGNLEVDVIPEIDKSAKDKLKAELKRLAKDLKIQFELELANGDVARTEAELAALAKNRTVKIDTEIDKSALAKTASALGAFSGFSFMRRSAQEFREELMKLDRAVPKIAVVSHAIAGLGAWVLGVSGNLFSLSSSIAKMGQAGLALPGLFGGIAIGLATTAAALKDFNKYVPQAAVYMHQLQNTISQNFWDKAAVPIRNLVDKLFPVLNKALAGTSTALGGFFAKLAGSASRILIPKLTPMFDALTKSIQIASGFTDVFVGIIEKLGTVGSSYLPSLAKWFGDIATQFNNWLGSADLTGMIQQGITAMKQFGSVIASTVSIFHSLGQAATEAGGSTLASLSTGLANAADAVRKGTPFFNSFRDTLKASYAMMDQISSIAGENFKNFIATTAQRFQTLSPIIGDTIGTAISAVTKALSSPAVTQGLTAMFSGINSMVHSLAPAMEPLAEKFGALGELIGAVAKNLGVVLAAAIENMAPVFAKVAKAILPVINMLGPMVAGVIKALGPVFNTLGDVLSKAATALQPLFKALQKLINLLMPILVPVLNIVVGIIGDSLVAVIQGVTWVIEGLTKIISGVIDVFKGLWKIISSLFTLDFSGMWDGLKQVFGGLGKIILGALQAALGAVWAYMNGTVLGFFKKFGIKLLGPVAKPLGKFFKPLMDGASKAWSFLKKVFGYITEGIKYIFKGGGGSMASRALEVLAYPFETALKVIKTTFNIIKTVVKTAWTVIKAIFEGAAKVIGAVVKAAWTVISTIFKTYFTVWKTIIKTAWDVIKTIFSTAFTVIKTVVSAGLGAIKGFITTTLDALYFVFKGPWDAIAEFLSTTWANIKAGFMLIWDGIRTWFDTLLNYWIVRVQTVWQSIQAITSAVWNAIKTVFTVVWTAIKTIVTTYINIVKTVVSTVWKAIKSVSSTVWNAIEKVIKGVWNGIKSVVNSVANAVKSVVTKVWNTIKSATSDTWNKVKSLVSGAWNTIKSLVSGAVGRVKSLVSGAWSSIRSATSSAWSAVKSAVSTAWSKVKTAVVNGVSDVVSKVKSLPGKAKAALAGIGSVLINAGKNLIQGFINGIGSMFDSVKNKLGDLTSKLTSWKGPPKKDKVLLTPAGQLIMDSLIQGFESKFTAIRSMLTDLTNEIAGFIGKSMSQQISDALSFAMTGDVGAAITANASVQGVNLDRRLGGLERQISTAAKSTSKDTKSEGGDSIHIDSITIPLEDLAQLKDLEEFFDLLRVRTRQG